MIGETEEEKERQEKQWRRDKEEEKVKKNTIAEKIENTKGMGRREMEAIWKGKEG